MAIDLLVAKDLRRLVQMAGGTRYATEEDIEGLAREIELYGRTLIRPLDEAFRFMSVVEVENANPRRWAIAMPLWTLEEGRSDLTLELTLIEHGNAFDIELDNLHVL